MKAAIQQWFNGLPKREQYMLMAGTVVVVLYLVFIVFYQNIVSERDAYLQRTESARQDLVWMRETVATIESLRGSGRTAGQQHAGRSLALLSEQAASEAGIRINRFAPVGDNDAQVWFERVEFGRLLQCLATLELEYGIVVENIAVNSANAPGVVNARLRISR